MKVLHLEGGAADVGRMAEHFGGLASNVDQSGTSFHSRERRVTFNNSLISGAASSVNVQPGFHLALSDLRGHQPLNLPIEHSPTELEFSFCRSPGVRTRGPEGEDLTVGPNEFHVSSLRRRTQLSLEAEAGAVERSVRLNLSVSTFQDLLGCEVLPSQLRTLMDGPGAYSTRSFPIDSKLESTVDALFESVHSLAPGRSLFVHGKAMELLALVSDRLDPQEEESHLPVDQIRRLHEAKELLLVQLDSPPSVQQLAQKVHMGERQLKSGFKLLFGSPVMTYARRVRMERAQKLLSERRHNVTEVARLLGYANPSKFAAAFRRQYGVSPSAASGV